MGSETGPKTRRVETRLMLAGVLVATLAVVLESLLPRGAAGGAPYVLLVLLGLWARRPRFVLMAAGLATALTLLGPLLSPPGGGQWMVVVNRSITLTAIWLIAVFLLQRKKAEEKIDRSNKELEDIRHALDQAAIVAMTDEHGVIKYVNDKFCEISKYSRQELLGQTHRIINSRYHTKAFIRNLWETIAKGRVWRGEIRNQAKDGAYYWVDTTIVPFLNGEGKPYQYLAIRSDITDRKKAEEELRKQEALARLGQMAAVVAHEVRNPLAGIGGAIEIIGSRLPTESSDRQVITSILQRIDSLNRRVEDLLLFSRPKAPQLAPIRLHSLLRETADLLTRDPRLASVQVAVSGTDLTLSGDPELLKDVFLNLLLNAGQAMGGKGEIRVSVRSIDGSCEITVEDSGPGISEDLRERIFEPFFSTKRQGTGLGLAIARRVVEAHGGEIDAACPRKGGTIVTVTLPLP